MGEIPFCPDPLWDSNLTWYTDDPDFTVPDTVPGAADQAEQRQERAVEHLEHFEVSLDVTFGSFVSRRPRVSRRGLHVGLRLSRQRRRERRQSCDVFARALPSGDVKWCALLIRWPMLKNVFWMNSRFPQK